MISGANDYQLGINPGGHVTQSTRSRATVTFDGGKTWTAYPIRTTSAYQATGDPAVDFDDAGNAYYATLGFRFVGPANAQNPDILVSVSKDGGVTWDAHVVARGSGNETSVGDLLDKEYVTAWGNGNALITYGDFRLGHKGATENGRIFATVTHDAGATWTTPVLVSGDALFAFVSTPVATANGRIFVVLRGLHALRQRSRRLHGGRARSPDGRPDRGAVQGRHPDRRRDGLPDRAGQPDLPGLGLPILVRRQHRGRPDERRTTSRSSGRTCATAPCPRPTTPTRP